MDDKIQKHQSTESLQLSSNEKIQAFKSRTKTAVKIEQGINGQSLVKFRMEYGEDTSLLLLSQYIKTQSEFFNLVDNISDNQAVEIAELLFKEYPFCTIEDLVVCFRYAKTGKPGYEKPMSRLDGRIIFNWMNKYIEEKMERHEEIEARKRHNENNEPVSTVALEHLDEILTKFTKPKPEPKPVTPHGFKSFEQQNRYIIDNLPKFTKRELDGFIKQFKSYTNLAGNYTEIINLLETELTQRQ